MTPSQTPWESYAPILLMRKLRQGYLAIRAVRTGNPPGPDEGLLSKVCGSLRIQRPHQAVALCSCPTLSGMDVAPSLWSRPLRAATPPWAGFPPPSPPQGPQPHRTFALLTPTSAPCPSCWRWTGGAGYRGARVARQDNLCSPEMRAAGQDKGSRAAQRLLTFQRHLGCHEVRDTGLDIRVPDSSSAWRAKVLGHPQTRDAGELWVLGKQSHRRVAIEGLEGGNVGGLPWMTMEEHRAALFANLAPPSATQQSQ